MNKIIKLTENSWLIKAGTENSGLLSKIANSYLFLSVKSRLEFSSINEVIEKFGYLEEQDITVNEQVFETINGYPVKHSNITIINNDSALYTKGTNLIFAAGYWAFKPANIWLLAYCPKQKTITENESIGPFKNRLEAMNQVSILNNRKNIEDRKGD